MGVLMVLSVETTAVFPDPAATLPFRSLWAANGTKLSFICDDVTALIAKNYRSCMPYIEFRTSSPAVARADV